MSTEKRGAPRLMLMVPRVEPKCRYARSPPPLIEVSMPAAMSPVHLHHKESERKPECNADDRLAGQTAPTSTLSTESSIIWDNGPGGSDNFADACGSGYDNEAFWTAGE